MVNENFQELVLKELKNLNGRFDGLDAKVDGLDAKVDGLDAKVDGLDAKVAKLSGDLCQLKDDFSELKDEFRDFTGSEELEHQATRKLINQAFNSINENLLYQEKVDRMERMVQGKHRNTFVK